MRRLWFEKPIILESGYCCFVGPLYRYNRRKRLQYVISTLTEICLNRYWFSKLGFKFNCPGLIQHRHKAVGRLPSHNFVETIELGLADNSAYQTGYTSFVDDYTNIIGAKLLRNHANPLKMSLLYILKSFMILPGQSLPRTIYMVSKAFSKSMLIIYFERRTSNCSTFTRIVLTLFVQEQWKPNPA